MYIYSKNFYIVFYANDMNILTNLSTSDSILLQNELNNFVTYCNKKSLHINKKKI